MSFTKQPHYLRFAEKYDYLSDSLCAAAYEGKILIGLTTIDKQNRPEFDMNRTVIIQAHNYPQLIEGLRKGQQRYETSSTEVLELDVHPTCSKKEPIYKLYATYSKKDEASDFLFQLRYRWYYARDPLYWERVRLGLREEIVSDKDYQYIKRGVVLTPYTAEQLSNNIVKLMNASYIENNVTHPTKLTQFAKFALAHFAELTKAKLDNYLHLKHKEKVNFVETVLAKMMERDPEYRGDEFQIQEYLDMLVNRLHLVFAFIYLYA